MKLLYREDVQEAGYDLPAQGLCENIGEKEMEALKQELPVAKWQAQYQQNPTSEEGAIVKRDWWKVWPHDRPPECSYVIQTWDTAYLKTQRNDYSACTTWGVFDYEDEDTGRSVQNIILIDAFKDRIEFPRLKDKAMELYSKWTPDSIIVEAKASGWPLIQEMRAIGIPVVDYTPVRGTKANPNDKVSRVNGISDLFRSGMVWRPDKRFAEMVMEEFGDFPTGEHDDLVDLVPDLLRDAVENLAKGRRGVVGDDQDRDLLRRRIRLAFALLGGRTRPRTCLPHQKRA